MGIPRFGAHLKPYATKTTFGSTNFPAQNTIAIIDGPGLAHYIYYQYCTKQDHSSDLVTYSNIVDETFKWLDMLSSIGYKIEAILFDGDLPESKKATRIGRLQSYIDRLQAYKQSIGHGLPIISGNARRSLPPLPFLVFAVVEELLQHELYAKGTYVVPGEADGFCVAAASLLTSQIPDTMISIFSDDADLLVYELPTKTCVAPFRDLHESRTESGVALSGEVYWSAAIVEQLSSSLPSLVQPAYFMAQDPHCDVKQGCRKALTSSPVLQPDFEVFNKTFETETELAAWKKLIHDPKAKLQLAARDSRMSELICRLQQAGKAEGVRMYLPFLLEDPARATAWNVGTDVRTLAYSVLLCAYECDSVVQEYRRSGMRVASTLLDCYRGPTLEESVRELAAHIESIRVWATEEAHLSECHAWQYIAAQHAIQYLHTEGYPLPSIEDTLMVIANKPSRKWHLLHLSAQYQAMFYSLRLLAQAMAHVVSMLSPATRSTVLSTLPSQLVSLPRTKAFFLQDEQEDGAEVEGSWRERIGDMLAQFRKEEKHQSQGKKRKKKQRKPQAANSQISVLADNPFALLADG